MKKLKKLLSVTLVLSMLMSLLSVPALADETLAPEISVEVTAEVVESGSGTSEDPKVTVTTETEKDDETGETTTTVTTEKEWNDVTVSDGTDETEGTTSEGENETTPAEETAAGTGENAGTDAEDASESEIDKPDSTVIETTVTGSETTVVETTTDEQGRKTSESGSVEGSETTEVVKTETEVTVTEHVEMNSTTTETTTVNGETTKVVTDGNTVFEGEAGENAAIESEETEGEWNKVEGSETPGEWVPGDVDENAWNAVGGAEQTQGNAQNSEIDLSDKNPLNGSGSVTIDLKPGDKNKKTSSVTVSLEELVNQNVTIDDYAKQAEGTVDVMDGDKKIGTQTTEVEIVEKCENGKLVGYEVITTVTTVIEKGESAPAEGDPQYSNESEPIAVDAPMPENIKEGTEDIVDESGKKIGTVETLIEEVIDEATGKKVWKVTKIKTTNTNGFETTGSNAVYEDGKAEDIVTFTLPEKPLGGETVDEETGEKTVVTVEEITESGKVVGYKSITKVFDKDGNELSSSSDSVYGTTTTVSGKTETDATIKTTETDTTTVVTETYYYSATEETRDVAIESTKNVEMEKTVEVTTQGQVVVIEGQEYAFYGTMGVVDSSTTVATGDEGLTGTISLDQFTVEPATNQRGNRLLPPGATRATMGNDLQDDNTINSSWYTPYSKEELVQLQGKLNDGEYVLIGFGLLSEYNVFDSQSDMTGRDTGRGAHAPKQYAVLSKDGISYGYCVELNKAVIRPDGKNLGSNYNNDANNSTKYDDYVYQQLDLDDMLGKQITIPLKNGKDALAPLNSIVTNGYWGTSSGAGSLDSVKQLLCNHGYTETQVDAMGLTEGQALTATQMAIWKYGINKSNATFNSFGALLVQYYSDSNPEGKTIHVEDVDEKLREDYDNIKAVYDVLTTIAAAKEGASSIPTEVTENTVKSAQIVLKEEVPVEQYGDVQEAVKKAKSDNDKIYDTDVSFTLAISNSTYNGDLVVNVYAGNSFTNPIATRRIAGTGTEQTFGTDDVSTSDGNTTYTIRNIKLAENVNITLKLNGTQNLADGVFVYKCDNSQNFIGGLTSKSQTVDLAVNLSFRVDEPSANKSETGSKNKNTYSNTRVDTKVDKHQEAKVDEHKTGESREEITEKVNTKVYADITVTEVTVTETKTERDWSSSWENSWTYPVTSTESDTPNTPNTPEIPDTPIPLREIPVEEIPFEDLPDDPTPLSETPFEDIPEDDVPLADLPFEDIPEDDVPLVELPYEEVPLVELPFEEIPLAELPYTGDSSIVWITLTLFSALALAALSLLENKKRKAQ